MENGIIFLINFLGAINAIFVQAIHIWAIYAIYVGAIHILDNKRNICRGNS
jgi:hypothetical protein